MKKLAGLGVLILLMTSLPAQENTRSTEWSMFRGPNGSGVFETTGLPHELGPDTNIIWKKALATGYSSPVLFDHYIFVTTCEDEKLFTLCLERKTGKTLWKKEAPRPRKEKLDFRNNPASPSPVTDGKVVSVFFPDYGMLAYDISGKELWRVPLGPFNNNYGMGASPIMADNKVILVCDQNLDSFILAVDKRSGKILWKTPRPEAATGHSTPIVYSSKDGETQILVPGSFLLISYSAKTGDKLWWTGGLSFEMKSVPVIKDGLLFINGYGSPMNQPENLVKLPSFQESLKKYDTNKDGKLTKDELPKEPIYDWVDFVDLAKDGYIEDGDWSFFQAALASLNGMLAIRLGGKGDMTEQNIVWSYRRSVPQLPSPVVYNNMLYMINDGGKVTTFKPESGDVISEGRLRSAGSKFYASPVAADNKVYFISLRGIVSVLKADGNLDILAQSDLKEECYATPAIADGRIYIRTVNTLYCFGSE